MPRVTLLVLSLLASLFVGCAYGTGSAPVDFVPGSVETPATPTAPADPNVIMIYTDARFEGSVREAAAEWAALTGFDIRVEVGVRDVPGTWVVQVGKASPYLATTHYKTAESNLRDMRITYDIDVEAQYGITPAQYRMIFLHEFGHAFGLLFWNNIDIVHYTRDQPSVMYGCLWDNAEHLGPVEVEAWEAAREMWPGAPSHVIDGIKLHVKRHKEVGIRL
jgi:hypothetical protein